MPKKYIVEVKWAVSRTYDVEAESREEAEKKMKDRIDAGEICVWTDDFEAGDDVAAECVGEDAVDGNGDHYDRYYD